MKAANEELQTVNQENRHKVAELSELTADLQSLMAATDIATIFLDCNLRIMRFTPRIEELFNIRISDRARPISDLTNRLCYPALLEDARATLERLTSIEREVQDDSGRCYMVRILPYRRALNRIEGVVITFIDFTERKRVEVTLREKEENLRALSGTLEGLVKERTARLEELARRLRCLAVELASAEQRERRRLAALLHDDLQQLLVASLMHLRLVSGQGNQNVAEACQLLDQAIESARDLTRELRPPVLYEDGLVAALRWLSITMSKRHNIKVELDAGPAEPKLDHDMRALPFEISRELLLNAAKHSGSDKVHLEVREDDGRMRLTVSDDGRGFNAEVAGRDQGSGFGLFSIRERLAALGGAMHVHTGPGAGTRVEVEVPLSFATLSDAPPEPTHPTARTEEPPQRAPGDQRIRVLIADDHAIVREGIARLLNNEPRFVVAGEAADGAEAIRIIERDPPDVVLLDVNMPRMNGLEAARHIHHRWPDLLILGLSIQDDEATANSMREAGATAFVTKSGDSEYLIRTNLEVASARASADKSC
jgi:two-component system, chemotaxis family, CheB/CheR fusion protein